MLCKKMFADLVPLQLQNIDNQLVILCYFSSLHSTQSKNNKKEKKKNKMSKFDSRILGFSVTAARDRLNIGDLDHTEAT